MKEVKDISLADFSNLSYVNIPKDLKSSIDKGIPITLKELSEKTIDIYLQKQKDGTITLQEQSILNVLKECENGAYKDFKIVDYKNNNTSDGFVGIAIETEPSNVVIASRGSESGDDVTMIDWIDNIKLTTLTETDQQRSAREFINSVGSKYDSICITGHSKGGNNALYSVVTADEEIRKKIEKCITFNAPGFNDEFIEYYKDIISELNKKGVITEYQGEGDFVSAILNNLSDPKVVKNIKWDGKGLFNIHDHYVYAMLLNGDGTDFVLSESGKKGFPNFVNNIVEDLLNTLSEEEVEGVVALAEKILMEDDIKAMDILIDFISSGVSIDTVKTIILHTIVEGYNEFIKVIARKKDEWVGIAKGFISDTKNFIVNNINKAKNFVTRKFNDFSDSVVKLGKEAARSMLCGPINISVKNIIIGGPSILIGNMIYNTVTDKSFSVKTEDLELALKKYKPQLNNVDSAITELEAAVSKLLTSGWLGQAATFFYSIRFIVYKSSLKKVRDNLSFQIRYLEAGLSIFKERVEEEKKLLAIL